MEGSLRAKLARDRIQPVVKEGGRSRVLHGPVREARRIDRHAHVGTAVGSGNDSAYHGRASPIAPEPAVWRHRDEHHVVAEHEPSHPGRQPTADPCSWSIGQQWTQLRAKNATGRIGGRWRMKRSPFAWSEHRVSIGRFLSLAEPTCSVGASRDRVSV
jgi:hypothetical protein